ncbi:MAG: alpha/beta fold hydrolase [Pseudomonadota bacterium]
MNKVANPQKAVEANAFEDDSTLDVVQAMIQMVYSVAVEPERFEQLVATWDAFDARAATASNFLILAEHFEQALAIAANPKLDRTKDAAAILDLVSGPAILVDAQGQFLAGNTRGRALVHGCADAPNLVARFCGDWQPELETETRHFQYRAKDGDRLMATCRRIILPDPDTAHYLIRFAVAGWSDEVTATLMQNYGLTEAEVAVAQLLYDGCSAVDIAKARRRSPETIRTQIKSVMTKTDTRKQAGFVQFMSHLQYMAAEADAPATVAPSVQDAGTACSERRIVLAGGQSLVLSEYGALTGRPVIYFTTSSRPSETEAWRAAVASAGLRFIAPHRPGFGGSDKAGDWAATADRLAKLCQHHLGLSPDDPPLFVGHREGGILACDVALRLQGDLPISDIVLIGTGIPGSNEKSHSMARNARAISTLPAALRLGYRTARRVFLSGNAGAQQIANFFFKDSPVDQALIRQPGPHAALMANLAYCFENTDAIVEDVGKWTSDWAGPLRAALPGVHWHFLHGDSHDFMDISDVSAFCAQRRDATLTVLRNTAQYGLYADPGQIVQKIKGLRDAGR